MLAHCCPIAARSSAVLFYSTSHQSSTPKNSRNRTVWEKDEDALPTSKRLKSKQVK